MAVSRPKHRFSPRATLYSPPPSETSKLRVVQTRRSPGSKRSITSPRLMRSQRHCSLGLTCKLMAKSLTPQTIPGPFLIPLRGGIEVTRARGQMLPHHILIERDAQTGPVRNLNPAVVHNRGL